MGIRIHRAIGWGMSYETLKDISKHDFEKDDGIYSIFADADKDLFMVPKEHCSETFSKNEIDGQACFTILEKDLLAKNYTDFGRKESERGRPEELFECTGYDDYEEIIFFPSLYQKKRWYHYDNDVDYAFEQWRENQTRDNDVGARDFHHYVPYGHYPYSNFLMTEDGRYHAWEYFTELRKKPEIVPGVPSEIRYYLKALGILDDQGVNKLRPIIAQWWS